jgi:hypothetical protein
MLRRVALVRTDVSEEFSASFIRMRRIGELGTTLSLTSNRRTLFAFLRSVRRLLVTANVVPSSPILVTLMKEAVGSSETSVLTRVTLRNIPEDAILYRGSCSKHYLNISNYLSVPRSVGASPEPPNWGPGIAPLGLYDRDPLLSKGKTLFSTPLTQPPLQWLEWIYS